MAAHLPLSSAALPANRARRRWKSIICRNRRAASEVDQRHDQEIHGEDPDQDHLPQPQIARAVMIRGNIRVAVEEPFPNPENVKAAEENDDEQRAEYDPQKKD